TTESMAALYAEDETAWLEAMAALIRRRDLAGLDLDNLGEYLTDMARRDRREVKSRLVVLMAHLLKWKFQRDKRSRSWRTTVLHQRQELADLAGRGVLRAHAEAVLPEAYENAVELAASGTGLPRASFPADCPYTIEQLFAIDLPEGEIA
ncbi:MAG TPA: DUF29 domain-containing protein, partial [Isosphaeraceae bacterium]|nr:DUF29 domain-containing protein [Isosphaeraceae bacterium]